MTSPWKSIFWGFIMTKRIVLIISTVCLLLCICSCDKKNKENTNDSDRTTETQSLTEQSNDSQEASDEIEDMKIRQESLENQNKELEDTLTKSQINIVDTPEFEWLNTEVWDEIHVIQYYRDYDFGMPPKNCTDFNVSQI